MCCRIAPQGTKQKFCTSATTWSRASSRAPSSRACSRSHTAASKTPETAAACGASPKRQRYAKKPWSTFAEVPEELRGSSCCDRVEVEAGVHARVVMCSFQPPHCFARVVRRLSGDLGRDTHPNSSRTALCSRTGRECS